MNILKLYAPEKIKAKKSLHFRFLKLLISSSCSKVD